ncbi:hypothetical protein [Thermodesulfovibrio aggregans]|uniref:hypothetical protein n=1 Tax=Thermodesulfovibrio aggregans TaxID=86166 RepID=UPI000A5F3611|nr:hypothetical protein [Thermodesulfovibrio aggregans]
MVRCKICNNSSLFISKYPGVCLDCIKTKTDKALKVAFEAHKKSRLVYSPEFIN